jgi:hypothetical protein
MVPTAATRLVPLSLTHEYFHNQRFLTLVMEKNLCPGVGETRLLGVFLLAMGRKLTKAGAMEKNLKHPHYQGSTNQTSLRIFQTIG